MKGIILAAGYATRLYPLTRDRAKALLPVRGRPIIDYIVDQMLTLPDLDQIIVVSNHRFAGQFGAWAEQRRQARSAQAPDCLPEIPLLVLDDGTTSENDRLGAIGDMRFCIDQLGLDDDLLVIAGDNLFTYQLLDAWRHFRRHGDDMILARRMPPEENLHRYAIVTVDDRELVLDLEEKPDDPKSNIAVFATYFYRKDTAPLIAEYLSAGNKPDAPGNFPAWLYQRKPVRVFFFDGVCIDIGTPESYEDVRTTFPLSATGEHEALDFKEANACNP